MLFKGKSLVNMMKHVEIYCDSKITYLTQSQ